MVYAKILAIMLAAPSQMEGFGEREDLESHAFF